MDTSDPLIDFDDHGVCNHCRQLARTKQTGQWQPNESGAAHVADWVKRVQSAQCQERYDCIIGLSGGADSSYLAVVARRLGLRCLAVHVDGGWNSEVAVRNIELLVKALNMDLVTHIVDWEEMRDLQVAFLKAGVPNQDIPQDHIFFSILYQTARKYRIPFQLQGRNYSSESVLPKAWGAGAMDGTHLRAIHSRFGKRKLKKYRVMSTLEYVDYFVGLPGRKQLEIFDPLNFMPYDPRVARSELAKDFGWTDYGQKHWESHWTKFFQSYYLPKKFGYDKRRAHLSSLILAGTLDRPSALKELEQPSFDESDIQRDSDFVRRKLELSEDEWKLVLMDLPHSHAEYPDGAKPIHRAMTAALLVRELTVRKAYDYAMRRISSFVGRRLQGRK